MTELRKNLPLGKCRTRLTADVVTGKVEVRPAAAKLPAMEEAFVSEGDGDLARGRSRQTTEGSRWSRQWLYS